MNYEYFTTQLLSPFIIDQKATFMDTLKGKKSISQRFMGVSCLLGILPILLQQHTEMEEVGKDMYRSFDVSHQSN